MGTLVDRPVEVTRTITNVGAQAGAVADPVRSMILGLLYRKSLTADEIAGRLAKRGHKKALTTVRHHIDVLRAAGLVDVVKVIESRGGVTKHYGTPVRLLARETPGDFGATHSKAIEAASGDLDGIIAKIAAGVPPEEGKKRVDPAYRNYVVAEVLNRAMTASMERAAPK